MKSHRRTVVSATGSSGQQRKAARQESESLTALRRAAEQGDTSAQLNLGTMYYQGQGVPQDHVEAVRWYRKAADQGNAVAQVLLGSMYIQGEGVLQDYAEAARWYRRAADQGIVGARFRLAIMYSEGQGVPQDYVEAHMWINLAASRVSGDEHKEYAAARENIAKKMTPRQIAEAQRRARLWKPKGGEDQGVRTQ